MSFRDRIKELRRVPAASLVPHPLNWRRHGERPHGAAGGGRVKRDKPFVARGIAAGNPNGWLVVVCKGAPKIRGTLRVTVREDVRCKHEMVDLLCGGVLAWCPECGAYQWLRGSRLWRSPRRA